MFLRHLKGVNFARKCPELSVGGHDWRVLLDDEKMMSSIVMSVSAFVFERRQLVIFLTRVQVQERLEPLRQTISRLLCMSQT